MEAAAAAISIIGVDDMEDDRVDTVTVAEP